MPRELINKFMKYTHAASLVGDAKYEWVNGSEKINLISQKQASLNYVRHASMSQ